MDNYTAYLTRARAAGIKSHCRGAAVMAFFFFSIFAAYAFAFYMGSIWVENGYHNSLTDEAYTSGDIITCFFGVIFGMFSLGMAAPNMKAVTEGKVAGKMVFDVIDR